MLTLNDEFYPTRDPDQYPDGLGWPRIGLIRTADPTGVYHGELGEHAKQHGLPGSTHWLPFEKGDRSDEGAGARWVRRNPLVIDWSTEAVELLRYRAEHGPRKPYFRNERAWGRAGSAWNRVGSYFHARRVPPGAIFSDKAPTVVPVEACGWLPANVLLALLNSSILDFCLRTFLGSRMMIEVGDLRALPLPVLDEATVAELDRLAEQAVAAKFARDEATNEHARQEASRELDDVERRIDERVLALYGFNPASDLDLWVVR